MGLVDMKSNLALGAGKPLGSPVGRHDPDPDLKTSNLDFGPPNEKLTNPGGRHLDSPVNPPTPIEVPAQKISKLRNAVAKAKTRGLSYILQKTKNMPNPAKKFLGDENWSGFVEFFRVSPKWESEGILALDSRFDRENTGDYMSNFFTFQSPKGEIWPKSSANVGGKLLPQAVISAVATETNLFLTDYFENTHAYGFTKNVQDVGTRFVGAGAEYSPQNERNKLLSEVGQTTAFISNVINFGGFLKNFTGKMFNSPTKSNYAGVNDETLTYTPTGLINNKELSNTTAFDGKGIKHPGFQPGRGSFATLSNFEGVNLEAKTYTPPSEAEYQARIGVTDFFESDHLLRYGFNKGIQARQSNFSGITGEQYATPAIHSLSMKRTKKFLGGPKDGWKYHGFKDSRDNEDHAGFTSGKNVHHASARKFTEPSGVWGDLVNLWEGTSLHQDTKRDARRANLERSKNRLKANAEKVREAGGLGPNDPGTVSATIVNGEIVQSSVQRIDPDNQARGGDPQQPTPITLPKSQTIIPPSEEAIESPQEDGRLFKIWDAEKAGLYGTNQQDRTDTWWGDTVSTSYIRLNGEDSQEKWDATGERFLSGPRAMQRAGERFIQFSGSPQFLIFEGKQLALQALNATAESRLYNPLSIASAFSSLARIPRHLTPSMTYMGKLGGGSGLAQGFVGAEPGFIIEEGRVEHQSHYQKGTTTPSGKVDMKKVDPNRYAGAFEGMNKLKLLGAQALTKMGLSQEQMKYAQDISITKNGFKYENVLTPKAPYFAQQQVKDMSEETIQDGTGMPKYVVNPINRKLTFKRNGKQEKNSKKSHIEKLYSKLLSQPNQVTQGHSGFGSKKPGSPSPKAIKPTNDAKNFETLNPLKRSFKPTNDGKPGMPEGGYEKEGLFKGVKTTLQPGKYKINQRVDGGRGFASAASAGTRKKDHYASGKKDARGNKTRDEVNVIPYGKPGKTPWENKDFVPFKFYDIFNEKQMVFRASFKSLTENITPDWNSVGYLGRPDDLHIYKGVSRDLNMNFVIYPYSYVEFKVLWAKLNYFTGLAYPSYEKVKGGGERMVAPMIELSIGDLYKKAPGFIKSMNLSYDMDATWEIKTGERLPKKIDVTCDFITIGKEQWKRDGNHFGFDAKKFNKKPQG